MSAWADVDAWAQQNTANQPAMLTGAGWRAFAEIVFPNNERLRCFAHASDRRIVIKRQCLYVPGKWRSYRVAFRASWPSDLSLVTWERVLVALDQWLEAGGKVQRKVPEVKAEDE